MRRQAQFMFSGSLNATEAKGLWEMTSFHNTDLLGLSQHPPQALLPTCLVDPQPSRSLSPDRSGQLGQRQPAERRNNYPGLGYLGYGQYFSPHTHPSIPSFVRLGQGLCHPHFCCALFDWALLLPLPVSITPASRIACLPRVATESSAQFASMCTASLLLSPVLSSLSLGPQDPCSKLGDSSTSRDSAPSSEVGISAPCKASPLSLYISVIPNSPLCSAVSRQWLPPCFYLFSYLTFCLVNSSFIKFSVS